MNCRSLAILAFYLATIIPITSCNNNDEDLRATVTMTSNGVIIHNLHTYKIIKETKTLPQEVTYHLHVDPGNGQFPTENELANVSITIKSLYSARSTFVWFHVPSEYLLLPAANAVYGESHSLQEEAWASAHHTPDLNVVILHRRKTKDWPY